MNAIKVNIGDISAHTKDIIQIVREVSVDKITMPYCIDVYRGSKASKIVSAGHHLISGAGKGTSLRKSEVERIFHFLMTKKILEEYNVTNRMGFCNAYLRVFN